MKGRLPMALFVGSNPKSDSWGEDYVLEKCIEYFDSSCVIYRNREVFGTQFDICVLIPNQGIAVIEVKAWKAESIIRVENGDSIVIRTETGAEEHYNPTKQAPRLCVLNEKQDSPKNRHGAVRVSNGVLSTGLRGRILHQPHRTGL